MQAIEISLFENLDAAPNPKHMQPPPVVLQITKAHVIDKGMKSGKPIVHLYAQDENGIEYGMLITGTLVRSLHDLAVAVHEKGIEQPAQPAAADEKN